MPEAARSPNASARSVATVVPWCCRLESSAKELRNSCSKKKFGRNTISRKSLARAALKRVLQQVEMVAHTDTTVLIVGETGTGKELLARAIHNPSPRRQHTFVEVNCAAIPMGLLGSELFGHEKGAFTGAIERRSGRFELAHQGTIFLDEVGNVPPELQPKLLRVLQEQEFERLGSSRTMRVDTRVVAATNGDLARMVADKQSVTTSIIASTPSRSPCRRSVNAGRTFHRWCISSRTNSPSR
jgi:transcriptional regulator with GAF, ATPase, and Fis domain